MGGRAPPIVGLPKAQPRGAPARPSCPVHRRRRAPRRARLQAARRAPAIVFLDELDALVPCRSARAGGGDQIYASGAAGGWGGEGGGGAGWAVGVRRDYLLFNIHNPN